MALAPQALEGFANPHTTSVEPTADLAHGVGDPERPLCQAKPFKTAGTGCARTQALILCDDKWPIRGSRPYSVCHSLSGPISRPAARHQEPGMPRGTPMQHLP